MSIQDTFACKLPAKAYDLEVFLANREPEQIVFQGKVVAIEPMPTSSEGYSVQSIHIKVSRWWRGQLRDDVFVVGEQGRFKDTSCEGVVDFNVAVGQELLFQQCDFIANDKEEL